MRYDRREVRIFAKNADGSLRQIQSTAAWNPASSRTPVAWAAASTCRPICYVAQRASEQGPCCEGWARAVAQNAHWRQRTLRGLVRLISNIPSPPTIGVRAGVGQRHLRLRDVRALPRGQGNPDSNHLCRTPPVNPQLSEYGIFIRNQTQNP